MFHLYHNPVLLSYQIFYKSNMSSATNGARTAYPSGAPEFTTRFSGARLTQFYLAMSVLIGIIITAFDYKKI